MAASQMSSFFDHLRRTALLQNAGSLSDGQLLQCFLTSREEAAFEAIVQRHGPMVLGVCRRVLQNAHDAEDAFQATFLVFLRKAASIVPREYVGNWLYGVAYRTALKAKSTAAKRRVKESQVKNMPKHDPPPTEGWHDLQPVLDQELNRLPDKYRLPVVLCDLQGKSRKEVARQLGWPEGTLSGRLARARTMLARRLTRHGLALSAAALAALVAQNTAAASVPAPLVASTVKAAALMTAGKTVAAGVISAKVAALTDGVLKTMLLAKLKIAAVLFLAVGVAGLGTGLCAQRLLAEKAGPPKDAEKDAAKTDGKKPPKLEGPAKGKGAKKKDEESGSFTGRVVDFSADGKQLTLEFPARHKGEGPQTFDVQLSEKTAVAYFDVGPKGAKPTKGYQAQVWLQERSPNTAARLHLKGNVSFKKPADLSGRVAAVSEDGKGITLALPAKKIKGQKIPQRIDIRFTKKTVLTFSNVGKDGAQPSANYLAGIWLEKDSKDVAAAVLFNGGQEKKKKGAVGKLDDQSQETTGTVVALAPDGKGFSLEILPPKKKGTKLQERGRIDVKIGDKTEVVYYGVGPGGARLVEGYRVQVWLQPGSKDTAAKVRFTGRSKKKKGLAGKVVAVSVDGKTLTLELPAKKKGKPGRRVDVQITGETKLVYNGVGPGGAKLTEGYRAQALLKQGTPDTAESIILGTGMGK